MSTIRSWCVPTLALAAIAFTAPLPHAAAQRTEPTRPAPAARPPTPTPPATNPDISQVPTRTTPPAATGAGGLPGNVTTAAGALQTYALPTISYGTPTPAPARSLAYDARIPQFETVSVAATVNGRATNKQLVVLNGRNGIENAPIDGRAKRLLAMHVQKLNLSESTVYFFDPQVAAEWLATHPVPPDVGPQEEEDDDDDGGSGCGIQNLGNCAQDPVGAVQDGLDAAEAEFERARERAQDWWEDSTEDLADLWDEALNCFSDHRLPGGSVPVRFDITPTMTVNLDNGASRGSGSVAGSVGIGIPMDGDLQAKVDFFYIPCLPFVVRPRSITVTGDLTVGEQLAINATAERDFSRRYTIPPTGGPRIPIYVIPIMIGQVPVAVIDVSAYIEGEVEVAASGKVAGSFTLSNEHRSTFDFTCSGQGCRTGSGARPTASTPITTTETVQVEGKVSAKPAIYTALMFTLNVNVLGARLGPQPYLLGTAAGCGAATATQTNGGDSTGTQNAALVADLDWGVDFRAEALVGGVVVGDRYQDEITGDRHVWFRDLVPGGSSALRAALAGPTQAATGQPTAYKLRMPSCYPYADDAKYRLTWTGNATPAAVPANACDFEAGRGECRFDPLRDLEVRFAWPAEGSYSLTAALLGDDHQTFNPALPPTELAVAVAGAAPTGASGGSAGGAPDRGERGGAPGGSAGGTPGRGLPGGASPGPSSSRAEPAAGSACCDIVPNPAMRGRLGRIVVAYPEEVSARIDVYRAGETEAVAGGYGDTAFDLFPGTYEVRISGRRVTGVTVRSAHDTQIRVGVLRVSASTSTRIDLVDAAGESFAGGYGAVAFGLPIGAVDIKVAGQTETLSIEAGRVTEF